ncbi:ATP-binding protein [Streptomyces sp. NBC_00094]|uniref:ATP-binding protein n=1 Tax=Streptomyces sp. NBC_00094 TaxID=2903620 RepID=UPI002254B702|nr:ATP-binding protein [Streptomyces sp. NBC_00094]MCX5391683.1 ATP-binding protein [Streptomyces sp. NBC_00094]
MRIRSGLWRVAELPTTKAGVERAFSYFTAGVRLGTVAQMVPAVQLGAARAPHEGAYLACWGAAALASTVVSVVVLVRRRPLGTLASALDFALACTLLVLGPLVLAPWDRFGTWTAFQPGYALCVIITAGGVRGLGLWAASLLAVSLSYVVYLGGDVGVDMASTAVGNVLTYVVYALVARMFFGYTRRIAHDADASRARAAELARREEERRAQVMMHNGVAVMRLLTEQGDDVSRARLVGQAEVELRRMRSYLRGGEVYAADVAGPSVGLTALVRRVCDRFADLNVTASLDLGAGLRIPTAQAEALERAFESVLLNVRAHARAHEVVVHLDGDGSGDGGGSGVAGSGACSGGWTLTVHDDGVGFDPASATAGVGLREVVVGELRRRGLMVGIESAVGEGTTVTVHSRPGPEAGTTGPAGPAGPTVRAAFADAS